MTNIGSLMKQFFLSVLIFVLVSNLKGQFQSKIVNIDLISEDEKIEISFLFDEIIERDDVSGWIDRKNYFTLNLFNVSLNNYEIFNQEFKYPLISVDQVDTYGSVQIIFNA